MSTRKNGTWAKQGGESLYPSNAQSKEEMGCRERKPKGQCVFHVARVKQIQKCTTESDKPRGNGKRVKAKKAMDLDRSGACTQSSGHHLPIPSQYRRGGPWIKGMRGCGLAVGRRREPILGFLLKHFWEKCSVGMTSHPKEVNMS